MQLGFREQFLEIRLVRGAGDNGDLLSLEDLRLDLLESDVLA
jgi:hypothetical protein